MWASLINVVLLMHQEMPDELLIRISWYLSKGVGVREKFTFDTGVVEGSSTLRAEKLRKRAQVKFLLSHLSSLEVAKGEDILRLLSID